MKISEGLTWIISVISAMHCCLERRSVVKVSPSSIVGDALRIGRFNAVDINNKTCANIHQLTEILYVKELSYTNHD